MDYQIKALCQMEALSAKAWFSYASGMTVMLLPAIAPVYIACCVHIEFFLPPDCATSGHAGCQDLTQTMFT